jgi:hypothetical protein
MIDPQTINPLTLPSVPLEKRSPYKLSDEFPHVYSL